MTVSFDPNILQPVSPAFDFTGTRTEAAGGYIGFVDPNQPSGRLRVGAFGTTKLSGSGTLINLKFNVVAGAAATSPLDFIDFKFGEEGNPPAATTNGSFRRLGPTAATASIMGRVITASGRGIRNVHITLTDSAGNTRTTVTKVFGYYQFKDIPAG